MMNLHKKSGLEVATPAARATRWRAFWSILVSQAPGWQSPWLDESSDDGNPIFSAWNPRRRLGLRIVEDRESNVVRHWVDQLGEPTDPEFVQELVYALPPSVDPASLLNSREVRTWLQSGALEYDAPPEYIFERRFATLAA